MKIVIEIEEDEYRGCKRLVDEYGLVNGLIKAVTKGKPLPEKHGALKDIDQIGLTDFEIFMCNGDYKEALKMLIERIEKAPTIIEADKGDK